MASKEITLDLIRLEVTSNEIVTITMCDQANNNQFSLQLIKELMQALDFAKKSQACVVILAGLTDIFCAGASRELLVDILAKGEYEYDYRFLLPEKVLSMPMPVIAAMQGHAIGGGLALALCADILIAANESHYGFNFMKLGFTPGMGVTGLYTHVFLSKKAKEMLFSGNTWRGEKLKGHCGFNYILPQKKVMPKALELAAVISMRPKTIVQSYKQKLSKSRLETLRVAFSDESTMHDILFLQADISDVIEKNYVN